MARHTDTMTEPMPGRADSKAAAVRGAPESAPSTFQRPEQRMVRPVMVQTMMVSMNGPSMPT